MAENTKIPFDASQIVAQELDLPLQGVQAVIELLNQAATVPFIARYRKERTGGLDEVQIRNIDERNTYHLELQARKETVLNSIEEQGKLTPELKKQIQDTNSKTVLEDLYLPYKPKRKTRATIAKSKGLQPLADLILAQDLSSTPESEAAKWINPELDVQSSEDAMKGALDIVAEAVAETAAVREYMRTFMLTNGTLNSQPTEKSKEERSKFEQYYDYSEPVKELKSHRFLAIRRGEREGFLRAEIKVEKETILGQIAQLMNIKQNSPYAPLLTRAIEDAYERLLITSIESDVRVELKQTSDKDAVDVFAHNLRDLLLAAPLGAKAVIGVDPGIRTGCKCVALDNTGKFLENITIYPYNQDENKASAAFFAFVKKNNPIAIAVGNGTAGRETEAFVRKTLEGMNKEERPFVVMVSESGASIYSASDVARDEFPELDLTVRGAISIARRLQDPLSELVKIDPKSIGVGQYQHDVFQPMLKKKLDEVVESCVNLVGVELNLASAQLLQYVAGIGPTMAKKIVAHRDQKGKFTCRKDLLKVTGLGPKTFEQSAGFLRIKNSTHPLDASAVHPERYATVEKIANQLNVSLASLIGNMSLINQIDPQKYVSEDLGLLTLNDIITELKKPGRDPRAEFEPPKFDESIHDIKDLKVGMILDGVVTNVTNFGVFVDIGVHQDGLVHISQLNTPHYCTNPAEVVSVNMPLKVRVVDVDLARNRIGLTCKLEEKQNGQNNRSNNNTVSDNYSRNQNRKGSPKPKEAPKFSNNPFAALKK